MATHRSSEEWSQILQAYSQKQVTQSEFCEVYKIRPSTLQYQLRRAKKAAQQTVATQAPSPKLVELPAPVHGLISDSLIEVECVHHDVGPIKIGCESHSLATIIEQLKRTLS